MLDIVTFNCNSVRNNIGIVKTLLANYDIVLLQELMILRDDISIIKNIDIDWDSAVTVNDDTENGIIKGRPKKGVCILWRKELSKFITPVYCNECFIGVEIQTDQGLIFLLNVYLPFDDRDDISYQNYIESLSIIQSLLDHSNFVHAVIMGDFNVNYFKGRFWALLKDFLTDNNLMCADLGLPSNSFTYLSPCHNTTSWLDHVICSSGISNNINNLNVLYDCSLYDHFPLACSLQNVNLNNCVNKKIVSLEKYVYWNKMTNKEKLKYHDNVHRSIDCDYFLDNDIFYCDRDRCNDEHHHRMLDTYITNLANVLQQSSLEFTLEKKFIKKCVPGWNSKIKPFFEDARKNFLLWKEGGKPQSGILLDNMKDTRAKFRKIVKECKNNESKMRDEQMMHSLKSKNMKGFWNNVQAIKNNKVSLPSSIDGAGSDEEITNKFLNIYKDIFNDDLCASHLEPAGSNVGGNFLDSLFLFTYGDIAKNITKLNPCIGPDMIHSYHLKYGPNLLTVAISKFLNSCILHGFFPSLITNSVIKPTLKNKGGDTQDISNYRPIFSSSIFLKLFEYCILDKIRPYFHFSDHQHGFRPSHSTITANLILKETILNYTSKNSTVYASFMDLSKAFDKVSHDKIIDKLTKLQIPNILINALKTLITNHKTQVQYGSGKSKLLEIGNGLRQGGILSPFLFNVYINDVLLKITKCKIGCRLGLSSSNIIAYADDLVLLAPTKNALQLLINEVSNEITKINLQFNTEKTVWMQFGRSLTNENHVPLFYLNNTALQCVDEIKYLGIIINNQINDYHDIIRARKSFFNTFNSLIRKFRSLDPECFLVIFKSFCLQIYGADLWFRIRSCSQIIKQFGIGFHKSIKKIFKISTRESNHYICNATGLMTFQHYLNYKLIGTAERLFYRNPCNFIEKNIYYFAHNSYMISSVLTLLREMYGVVELEGNDMDAIKSRIFYVQAHEDSLR